MVKGTGKDKYKVVPDYAMNVSNGRRDICSFLTST
jgi:hypothetical protein